MSASTGLLARPRGSELADDALTWYHCHLDRAGYAGEVPLARESGEPLVGQGAEAAAARHTALVAEDLAVDEEENAPGARHRSGYLRSREETHRRLAVELGVPRVDGGEVSPIPWSPEHGRGRSAAFEVGGHPLQHVDGGAVLLGADALGQAAARALHLLEERVVRGLALGRQGQGDQALDPAACA